MLGWTLSRHFKNRVRLARPLGFTAVMAEFRPRTGKDLRLYLGVALVIALMTFPYWGRPLFASSNSPGPASTNPRTSKNPRVLPQSLYTEIAEYKGETGF